MKTKKEKPRCKNCGDETTFPSTVEAGRLTKGWCVPCYRYWFKNCRVDSDGREHWRDGGPKRDPYTGRLPETGE